VTCSKCKSNNFIIIPKGSQSGLYCAECGAWLKWLGKSEKTVYEAKGMQEIEPNIIVKEYVKIPLMEINSIINDNTISDNEKITKIKELINEYRNNNEKIF
jgi:PHP family Zn ribbon phosphoesterase